MPRLKLFTLGPPRIELDGQPVETSRNKAVALLVYLAVSGERHRRDALSGLFWPDYEQAKAYAYLRRTLWEINEALGEGWLDADRESIGLAPGADLWLDLAKLRGRLSAVRTHAHPPLALCAECLEALEASVALVRGDFMAGFTLRDSPGFDDWLYFTAEGLRQDYAEALRRLVAAHAQRRELDAAIDYARRWLALDQLDEEAHRQAMLLYALAGQRSAALRQYQECERILKQEVGVPPERKTTELFERIKSGQVRALELPASTTHAPGPAGATLEDESASESPVSSPAAAVAGHVSPATPAAHEFLQVSGQSRMTLPTHLTPFVGREAELAELQRLLADPQMRLLSILAVGGMGKTRLAVEAAGLAVEHFPDGVYFVPLAPLQNSSAIVPTIADVLELPFRAGAPPSQQLLDYLAGKELLLVLDNFEHLLSEAEGPASVGLLAEMLNAAPRIKILVTSRIPLSLVGEVRFFLAGMDVPEPEAAADVLDTGAVKLFVQSARRAQPGFRLDEDDLGHLARIVTLVQGMPLAILLAAGWTELLSPQEIVAEISRGPDFLATDLRDVPERQRSIRAVFAQTWGMLGEQEQQAFARLSIFRGSFSRQAAQAVAGASLRDLMSLAGKSLVQRVGEGRFVLHELLRQFGAEALVEDVDAFQEVHDRHSVYFCDRAVEWGRQMKAAGQREALAELESDLENLRVAWSWAATDRQVERLGETLEALCLLFFRERRYEEGDAACRAAVIALGEPESGAEQVVLANLLAWQAGFALNLGHPDQARSLMDQSIALLDSSSTSASASASTSTPASLAAQAFVKFSLSTITLGAGDFEQTQRLLRESLALYEALGDPWWMAVVLNQLATNAWTQNDLEQTQNYLARSLSLRRALGDRSGMAGVLMDLASLAIYDRGQVAEGEPLMRESAQLLTELGDRSSRLNALTVRASFARATGQYQEELALRQQQMAGARELGDRQAVSDAHMILGEVYQNLGDYQRAVAEGRESLSQVERYGQRHFLTWVRWALAASLLGNQAWEEARQLLRDNAAELRQIGAKAFLGRTLATLSRAEAALGDLEAAGAHALEAIALLAERHYFWLLEAVAALAFLLSERGEVLRAAELYSLVTRHPAAANSRWFADVYGRWIEAAAAGLPAEEVDAARRRGEALDLWEAARKLLEEYSADRA